MVPALRGWEHRSEVDRRDQQVRIAFMTAEYSSTYNGPGVFAYYLRQAVKDGLLDITFFSDDMHAETEPFENRVLLPPFKSRPGGQFIRQYAFHQAFLRVHQRLPFDLLWYNSAVVGFLSAVSAHVVPVVLMLNDYSNIISRTPFASREIFGRYRAFARFFWRNFERLAVLHADAVVVNSRFLKKRIVYEYGIDLGRVYVLYKGVDLKRFTFQPHSIDGSTRVRILFVKNDYVCGGLAELFKCLAHLSYNTHLTIIGPPRKERARIRDLADRSGFSGSWTLLGRVPHDRIIEHFQNNDILCVPSRSEGLGVVFMEALACGLPAIGTEVGGIPEVLDYGRAGWLVPVGNVQALKDAFEAVISNSDERIEKVHHGRRYVQKFSYENLVMNFRAIARDVMQNWDSRAST